MQTQLRQLCGNGDAEPASSLQTHAMGGGPALSVKSGGQHGALSGPQGAISGPQRMLSAEPSMRDLEGGFSTALLIRKWLFALN